MLKKLIHALGALIVFTPAYAGDVQLQRQKTEDSAIAVIAVGQDSNGKMLMRAMPIKVPHLSDAIPLLCFKDPTKHETDCFYLNGATTQVVLVPVPTNAEEVSAP